MHIISKRILVEFWKQYPRSRPSLEAWYRILQKSRFKSFTELRKVIPSADYVDGLIVFNIASNHYRLIAAIHFNRGKVYIRDILSHTAYDKEKWKRGHNEK